jgi:hypothetical protein
MVAQKVGQLLHALLPDKKRLCLQTPVVAAFKAQEIEKNIHNFPKFVYQLPLLV